MLALILIFMPMTPVPGAEPDLILGDLYEIAFHGLNAAGIGAFSLGTITCNVGDAGAEWVGTTNRHPVIAQNLYRLRDHRFEQVGMSWVKHAFFPDAADFCGPPGSCQPDPTDQTLGPGCADVYTAAMNGSPGLLGPRSQINAHTGTFVYPFTGPPPPATVGRRLQVHRNDFDPALNLGATYFIEGQLVSLDDAAVRRGDNNVSHRRMVISGTLFFPVFTFDGTTVREQPAIKAWKSWDPTVVETDVRIPGEGLFILAARVEDLGDGTWGYEYALYNLNSDRAAQRVTLPVEPDAAVTQIGFHDVPYHSGEPFDGSDWTGVKAGAEVSWFTETYDQNLLANALRWGTLYNFRFIADRPPVGTKLRIDLFKPGLPGHVLADTIGPQHPPPDCDGDGLPDACALDCGALEGVCAVAGCGESTDLDGNAVPDDCDPDCNGNGLPDGFDIQSGASADCNENTVPDECEMDSDGDGLPDACDPCPLDPLDDEDGDGLCADVDPCPRDPDNDADGDGVCAPEDQCPDDAGKIAPGLCSCGVADTDGDGDGVPDCLDDCPNDPLKNHHGVCGCGTPDVDSDGDAVPDCLDACPGDDDRIDLDANDQPDCVQSVPAASQWGLVILALLLLAAAKANSLETRPCPVKAG